MVACTDLQPTVEGGLGLRFGVRLEGFSVSGFLGAFVESKGGGGVGATPGIKHVLGG